MVSDTHGIKQRQLGAITLSPLAFLFVVLGVGCVVGGGTYFLLGTSAPPTPARQPAVAKASSQSQQAPAQAAPMQPPAPVARGASPQPLAQPLPSAQPLPAAQPLAATGASMKGPAPPAAQPASIHVEPTPQARAKIKQPKMNLRLVERALWRTKTKDPKAFKQWMRRFEDEVNVIYLAGLRQRNPNVDVRRAMPRPVRVEPVRVKKLLILRGYIDGNGQPGYQPKADRLLFAFEQRRPYRKGDRKISYALYDDVGFYYRKPGYQAPVVVDDPPSFVGFFSEPTWQVRYHRPQFVWFGQPRWWERPAIGTRLRVYHTAAPSYRVYYRRHYRLHYRPVGWRSTVYFQRRWWRPPAWGVRAGVNVNVGVRVRHGYRGGFGFYRGRRFKYRRRYKYRRKGYYKYRRRGYYKYRRRGYRKYRGYRGRRRFGGKW